MTLMMMDAKRRKECRELRGRLLELLEIILYEWRGSGKKFTERNPMDSKSS
ncbi:hypothetical protein C8D82_104103 [Victivallis vadensis]|uniref:Uncharacterized protein n=1 Tax=Victivallis vadensis TaxID=172901 RepID=A0A2U1B8I1_9BACT|nr:hypothetical protein C8D82_104103 [Victivallis vadensis]